MVYTSGLSAESGLYVPSTPGHYVIHVVNSRMVRIVSRFSTQSEARRFAENLSFKSVDTTIVSH